MPVKFKDLSLTFKTKTRYFKPTPIACFAKNIAFSPESARFQIEVFVFYKSINKET